MSTAVNRETPMPEGEGREVVHPDGSLTRVTVGTITTLAAGDAALEDDGSAGIVRLSQGALWHQPDADAPGGQAFAVDIGSARINTEDATFAVIVEADGSCFLTSIVGSVRVQSQGRSIPVAPLEAAMLSPTGELLDSIQATPDEVMGDPWVGANLGWSAIDPADVRVPAPPRFEPRPPPPREPDAAVAAAAAAAVVDVEPVVEDTVVEQVVEPVVEPPPIEQPSPIEEPPPIEEPHTTGWAMAEAVVVEPEVEPEVEVEPEPEPDTEPEVAAAKEATEEVTEEAKPEVEEAEDEDGAAAVSPEVVVPSAVLKRRRGAPSAEEDEEELAAESHRLRVGVAAGLVLIGLIVVVIAIRGLLSNDDSRDVATTDTTAAASGTTVAGPTTSAAPGTPTSAGAPTTAPAGSTTTAKGAGRYTVHPTRCAQTGSQLTAEGNLTNLDTVPHDYRVTVVFTTDGQKQAATAVAEVTDVAPNEQANWKATTTYGQDLSETQGGCKVGNVEIVK